MMKKNIGALIEEFIDAATKYGTCVLKGDFVQSNIYSDKIFAIRKKLAGHPEDAKKLVDATFCSEIPSVVSNGSLIAIDIAYRVKEAKANMETIAKDKSLKALSLNADIYLKYIYKA